MGLQEALDQLVEAIKESDIYKEYRRQSERVDRISGMREKINEYRARTYELQNNTRAEELLDRMEAFEVEYEAFREEPVVEEYLSAEVAFCRLMQETEVKLAEAVDFE